MADQLKHVAIIMDGNRRWAKAHDKSTLEGHEKGSQALQRIVEASIELGVPYLTVYGFSSENWSRDKKEVGDLLELMRRLLEQEVEALHEKGVCLKVIGDRTLFPEKTAQLISDAEALTRTNKSLQLTIALSYGSRQEIVSAAKEVARKVRDDGMDPDNLTEDTFASFLYTSGTPDPDLFIRPGGELRISNFLLWQISYAEFYFTKTYWPDFSKAEYMEAIASYKNRDRRFGEGT